DDYIRPNERRIDARGAMVRVRSGARWFDLSAFARTVSSADWWLDPDVRRGGGVGRLFLARKIFGRSDKRDGGKFFARGADDSAVEHGIALTCTCRSCGNRLRHCVRRDHIRTRLRDLVRGAAAFESDNCGDGATERARSRG